MRQNLLVRDGVWVGTGPRSYGPPPRKVTRCYSMTGVLVGVTRSIEQNADPWPDVRRLFADSLDCPLDALAVKEGTDEVLQDGEVVGHYVTFEARS